MLKASQITKSLADGRMSCNGHTLSNKPTQQTAIKPSFPMDPGSQAVGMPCVPLGEDAGHIPVENRMPGWGQRG